MKYVVKLDYATFAFTPNSVSLDKITESLTGSSDPLGFTALGSSERTPYHCAACGLYYKPDCGSKENPHILQVSGAGCELFRETLPELAYVLYAGGAQAHFKRVDFAFDVVMSKEKWRKLYSDVFNNSVAQLNAGAQRKRMKCIYHGYGDEMTLYIGARTSPIFCRVYNKTLQDSSYVPFDENGRRVSVNPDTFIIRFEVEAKYSKYGERLFDPSPLFDSYYRDPSTLFKWLEKVWRKYSKDLFTVFEEDSPEFVTDIEARGLSPIVRGYDNDLRPSEFLRVCSVGAVARNTFAAEESKVLNAMDLFGHRFIEALMYYPASVVAACDKWSMKRGISCPIDGFQLHALVSEYIAGTREVAAMSDEDFNESPARFFECEDFEEINIFKERRTDDDL